MENTQREIKNINDGIKQGKEEIERLREEQKKATDGKAFQELDSKIREIQNRIEEGVDYRENVLKPFREDLNNQNEEAIKRAQERKAEEEAEEQRKNLEKVANLANQEEELSIKKEDMDYAEELMNRYAAEYEEDAEGNMVLKEDQDLPWDWTEELSIQFEEEFYAAKDEYNKMNKSLDGVRKIKEEVDRVKQE